jgi:hypothetical protein
MLSNGAKELVDFVKCNAAANDQAAAEMFPGWATHLIAKLKSKYAMKSIKIGELLQKFKVTVNEESSIADNWEKDYKTWEPKLGKEFIAYHKSTTAKIIHIK